MVGDLKSWSFIIDFLYLDVIVFNLKHVVGAIYVGVLWEVVILMKLVYLWNLNDNLFVYFLN